MSSLSSIPNIIPILSGKGGVGKSSVTVQLALSLCRAGHSVGVLDIDLTGPSIPRLFGIEDAKVKQAPGGWLPVEVHPSFDSRYTLETSSTSASPKSPHSPSSDGAGAQSTRHIGSLHVMSLGFLLRNRGDAVVWRGPKKTAMVGQLLSEVLWPAQITHLLIDTPPGTSDEHISLMTTLLDPAKFPVPLASSADPKGKRRFGAVIVTTPQAISTADVRKELTFCKKVGLKVLGVVENMAGYVCPCCGEVTNVFSKGGGEVMARQWGVKFLGSMPIDGEGWGQLVEEQRWPTYGNLEVDGETKDKVKVGDAVDGERDESARMVEKYGACSLARLFERVVAVGLPAGEEGVLPDYRDDNG